MKWLSGTYIDLISGHCDQALDCHVCGVCLARFYHVERFIEHKKNCAGLQKQNSVTVPSLDAAESTPIDLSNKHALDDLDSKSILEDKSNLLFDPLQTIQTHQQQLLELYAQLAASRGAHTDSEQSSDDGGNASSYVLSPPSSSGTNEKIHPCSAERCPQRFSSRGALLWHILRRHPGEKLFQCEHCGERFSDFEQVREHRCDLPQRSASTGALERSPSPDADRSSVPAWMHCSYSLVAKSSSPAPSSLAAVPAAVTSTPPMPTPLSKMLFSHIFGPTAAATPPTSIGIKDAALDLSNPVHNKQQFLPIPTIPQQLIRPSFNFGQFATAAQRAPPRPELLLNGPSSASLLNNDDDWEALMEVSTTDESEKIRALVGDKALPTTDPNQCLLCRRVLSCKSALQMHYRTHTGERPFKCKICQRAFTTKGNLKTHMGVHRAKHSFRGIAAAASAVHHQCPICQKRFFTAQLLQQHIAQHTSQLTRNGILPPFEMPVAAQGFDQHHHLSPCVSTSNSSGSILQVNAANLMLPMKNNMVSSPFMPPFPFFPLGLPRGLPSPVTASAAPQASTGMLSATTSHQMALKPEDHHQQHVVKSERTQPSPDIPAGPVCIETSSSVFSPSGGRGSAVTGKDDDEVASTSSSQNGSAVLQTTNTQHLTTCTMCYKNSPNDSALEAHVRMDASENSYGTTEPENDEQAQRHPQHSGGLADEKQSSSSSTLTASTPNPLDAMQKMWAETEPPPPRQAPILSKHQCGVCFKHFSSSSALQIHMRTHTGDKPFKCEVCSRAFTTRGNLKVHMGTHMWQQCPSRRGRRIFEFGSEDILRAEMLPSLTLGAEGALRGAPFDPATMTLRPSGFSSDSSTSNSGTAAPSAPPPPPPPPFPVLPFPLPLLPQVSSSGGCTPNQMDAVMWMWKTVCSVCQKICATPQELERHLKQHLNGTVTDNGATPPKHVLLQKTE